MRHAAGISHSIRCTWVARRWENKHKLWCISCETWRDRQIGAQACQTHSFAANRWLGSISQPNDGSSLSVFDLFRSSMYTQAHSICTVLARRILLISLNTHNDTFAQMHANEKRNGTSWLSRWRIYLSPFDCWLVCVCALCVRLRSCSCCRTLYVQCCARSVRMTVFHLTLHLKMCKNNLMTMKSVRERPHGSMPCGFWDAQIQPKQTNE